MAGFSTNGPELTNERSSTLEVYVLKVLQGADRDMFELLDVNVPAAAAADRRQTASRPNLAGGFWLKVLDIGAPQPCCYRPEKLSFLTSTVFALTLHGHGVERS